MHYKQNWKPLSASGINKASQNFLGVVAVWPDFQWAVSFKTRTVPIPCSLAITGAIKGLSREKLYQD